MCPHTFTRARMCSQMNACFSVSTNTNMAVPITETPFMGRMGPYVKCDDVIASVLEYIRDHACAPPNVELSMPGSAPLFSWSNGTTAMTSTDPALTNLFWWAIFAAEAINDGTVYTHAPPDMPRACYRDDIGGRGLAYMLVAIARGELVQNHGQVPWISYTGEHVTWRDGVVTVDGRTCKYNAALYIVEKLLAVSTHLRDGNAVLTS